MNIHDIQQQITGLLVAWPELEEDEILRADMLEGETDMDAFLSKIIRLIGSTKAIASGTADYIGELQARKDRLERREHALRSLIFKVLQTANIRKRELPEGTLSVRNGSPKVVIIEESQIPSEFWRVKKEPDKTRIRAALSAGENVPGAALSNSEPQLAVIIK